MESGMSTPIRFRTDDMMAAEEARDRVAGKPASDWGKENAERVQSTPPIAAGDCWPITYSSHGGKPESICGYAICCPKCGQLHYWTHANNCASKRKLPSGAWTCDHQEARTSCWTWTLDERGWPVQAVASLFANGEGHCGYHGWLKDGALTDG
jgi:hypothetical protein